MHYLSSFDILHKHGSTNNGRRLPLHRGDSDPPIDRWQIVPFSRKEGELMSDFEILSIVFTVLMIVITLLIALINAKK